MPNCELEVYDTDGTTELISSRITGSGTPRSYSFADRSGSVPFAPKMPGRYHVSITNSDGPGTRGYTV